MNTQGPVDDESSGEEPRMKFWAPRERARRNVLETGFKIITVHKNGARSALMMLMRVIVGLFETKGTNSSLIKSPDED